MKFGKIVGDMAKNRMELLKMASHLLIDLEIQGHAKRTIFKRSCHIFGSSIRAIGVISVTTSTLLRSRITNMI